jgi:hypothetical protein
VDLNQRITVAGLAGTLKALNKLDPEVAKGIGKELNLAGRKIRDDAKQLFPSEPSPRMRNWKRTPAKRPQGKRDSSGKIRAGSLGSSGKGFPAFVPEKAKKSIRSSRREFVLTIQSQDGALGVFELAGTRGGKGRGTSGSPQGRQFMSLLPATKLNSGKKLMHGRVMRRALKDNYANTRIAIAEAAYKAAFYVQRRMP